MHYQVTKTYDHSLGLSACFRQWKADSHCKQLHGYALSFKLTFACERLSATNWVIDFGGLKEIKEFLCFTFDHTLCADIHDPYLAELRELDELRVASLTTFDNGVGCEAFAEFVFDYVDNWLQRNHHSEVMDRGLQIVSVECREHGANSAIFTR